jgi:2'-hydroxyisoflavone reductase
MNPSRRRFLQLATTGTLLGTAGRATPLQEDGEHPPAEKAEEKLDLLILGGTGILGPWTVRRAIERGHTMTLFNRGFTNPHLFPELEKLRGDRNTADLKALEGREWDAVVDTSAYVPSHVEATAGMAARYAWHYVLLSSISAYADHSLPLADASSPVRVVTDEVAAGVKTISEAIQTDYGALKARCEVVAESAMPGKVTVIRPGLISGPGDYSDRFGYWALRTARGGEVLAPGDGSDPVQYIDVRDLANWIIHCIEQSVAGVFNGITPPGRFDMTQLLHGLKASVVTDASFTWTAREFLQEHEVQNWTTLPVWVPAVGEEAGFHLARSDDAEAAGLTYRPLAETAADTVAWYAEEHPVDYNWPRGTGLEAEREEELLAAWHERLAETGKE